MTEVRDHAAEWPSAHEDRCEPSNPTDFDQPGQDCWHLSGARGVHPDFLVAAVVYHTSAL
jgi:hypothetical protein